MTTMIKPAFFDSPYFVAEVDNWHLKEGAPKDVVREFEQYMQEYDDSPIVKERRV